MQKVHVARQPIFKARNKLYAYELLFRDGPSNAFPKIDGDTATTQVLHHSFFSFDFDQLTAGAYGFVNFTQELLVRRIPLMFRLNVTATVTVLPVPGLTDGDTL